MRNILIAGAALFAALGASLLIPIQRQVHSVPEGKSRVARTFSGAPAPSTSLSLLFLHHSVGSQLLADPGSGPEQDERGGGLRRLLEGANYEVHSATYGSRLGEDTDLFHWPDKFSKHMPELLSTADGSAALPNAKRHDVVMFKSCYPNNYFVGRGTTPGNVRGPELTIENAKASLSSLLPEFQKYPETLFVYLTAPPVAPKTWAEPAWKWLVKLPLGKTATRKLTEQSRLAREFNDWVTAPEGWLKGYPLRNVAVIDYYGILTGHGASNLLVFPTGDGADSHPSSAGQQKAAPAVLDALNQAVERAGLGSRSVARSENALDALNLEREPGAGLDQP